MTTRSRFGLPPEGVRRNGVASPARAFAVLASAALLVWLVLWLVAEGGQPNHGGATSSDAGRAGAPVAAEERPAPTQSEALDIFASLYEGLRSRSLRSRVADDVPLTGRVILREILWADGDAFRVRQIVEISDWEVDISAPDMSVKSSRRRVGVEWTVSRSGERWAITDWTIVEDRAVVGGG